MIIVLDAGHGGIDSGVSYHGREEKQDALRLTLAVGGVLESQGNQVIYTRKEDAYYTPFQKVRMANESNADVFLSIHRNAMPNGGEASGVMSFVFADSGLRAEMARNINKNLEELGFENLGVKERPDLVLLRRTNIPAIVEEVGYLDSKKDNQIFDEKLNLISKSIANGVNDTVHKMEEMPVFYRVQTGAFKNRLYAERLLHDLLSKRYPAFLEYQDGLYKVQVASFLEIENAVKLERILRKNGYDTFITTK